MGEINVEKSLEELSEKIYVNHDLKQRLRGSFIAGRKLSVMRSVKLSVAAAVFILVITVYSLVNFAGWGKVSAASLNVENYTNLMSIGDGRNIAVSEHKGTIYMPVSENGVLAYDSSGMHGFYKGNANFAAVSRDGREMAIVDDGSIKIYHTDTSKVDEILKGSNETAYYEQPSWLPDDSGIIYTKRIMGKNDQNEYVVMKSEIYRYDFNTSRSTKITTGSYGCFIKGKNSIVFERDEKIVYKDLKDGSEKIIDEGSQPSASPDGKYIAFIKSQITVREVEKNVYIEQGLQDIYIADTGDPVIKKKVTSNIPLIDIDEKEWLASLKESDSPQTLSYSGKYCYLYPAWGSDSKSIIAMRKEFPSGPKNMNIKSDMIRIDLDSKEYSPRDIVKRYILAVASGDEDYAHYLTGGKKINENPDGLTVAGIWISDAAGNKGNIDARTLFRRDDNLYIRLEDSRYSTVKMERKNYVSGKKSMVTTEIMAENNVIYMKRNNEGKTKIIGISDIPAHYLPGSTCNITSLSYPGNKNIIYFTLENADAGGIKILSYNLDNREFMAVGDYKAEGAEMSAAGLSVDYSGDYIGIECTIAESGKSKSLSMVYGIKNNSIYNLNDIVSNKDISSVGIDFWNGDELILKVSGQNQLMRLKFLPGKGQIKSIM